MRLPFVMSTGLVALAASLVPRLASAGPSDSGMDACGDSSTICADAGSPDGSIAGEGGTDEGGPVTRPADATLRSLDGGAPDGAGEPGGGSGGGGCSTAGIVRSGVVAELGALVLAVGVLLRRRVRARGDRAARHRPSARV